MKRIIFTGGNGRFGKIFKNIKHKDKIDWDIFTVEWSNTFGLDNLLRYWINSKSFGSRFLTKL